MLSQIYQQISFETHAVYQIKIRGKLDGAATRLFKSNIRVSVETADADNPISMLTGPVENQRDLMDVLNILFEKHYPIISVICIEVPNEAKAY